MGGYSFPGAAIAAKPEGGYAFVAAQGLIKVWGGYTCGSLTLRDVRVWLAAHAVAATRCQLAKGRSPHFRIDELQELVNTVSLHEVARSVRRLEAVGVLDWSESALRFLSSGAIIDTEDEVNRIATSVVNARRKIPVHRRLLTFMAASRSKALIATVLGHLFRCVYYRRKGVCSGGMVKASWIAEVFSVDVRNVKRIRAQLVANGLLVCREAPQLVLNRHGVPTVVNLAWKAPSIVDPRKSPSPATRRDRKTPPPRETGNSFRYENHEPPSPAVSDGVRKRTGKTLLTCTLTSADLRDPAALMRVHRAAAARGDCGAGEAGRLLVFAAAAHALRVATTNAPGLLVANITNRRWHMAGIDEDAGRAMLRAVPGTPPPPADAFRTTSVQPPVMTRQEIRRVVRESLGLVA